MDSVISHSRILCLTLMHVVLAQSKSFHGEWWGSQQVRPIYIYRPRWFTRLNCCHYKSNIVIRNKRDHSICETEQGEGSGYGMEWNNGPLLYFIKTLWVQPNHLYDSNPTRKVITLWLLASPFWHCTPKPIMAKSHDKCYRLENNFFLWAEGANIKRVIQEPRSLHILSEEFNRFACREL